MDEDNRIKELIYAEPAHTIFNPLFTGIFLDFNIPVNLNLG